MASVTELCILSLCQAALRTSALKFGFLVPAPALQDPREEVSSNTVHFRTHSLLSTITEKMRTH